MPTLLTGLQHFEVQIFNSNKTGKHDIRSRHFDWLQAGPASRVSRAKVVPEDTSGEDVKVGSCTCFPAPTFL